MKIAVLGWGLLIWSPKRKSRALNLADDKWFSDGPGLPIEFARISRDKMLTLVLFPVAKRVPVLWAMMALNNLDEALDNLREVEGIPAFSRDRIGYVNLQSGEQRSRVVTDIADEIKRWACMKKVEAVIWTDRPPQFEQELNSLRKMSLVILKIFWMIQRKKQKNTSEGHLGKLERGFVAIEKKLGWFPV